MAARRRFPRAIAAAVHEGKYFGIRAGREHRFIGIWAVVVDGRVFVRSWTMKPQGWYRTFLEDARGAIQVGPRQVRVRAVRTSSERLLAAVDRAYREKYNTRSSLKYVRGFERGRRRASTTELVPV